MARPLRIELADGYYHVMNRGNNRQDIFLSDKNQKLFLEALADNCEIFDIQLMAYVMMTNHFHLSNKISMKQFCRLLPSEQKKPTF